MTYTTTLAMTLAALLLVASPVRAQHTGHAENGRSGTAQAAPPSSPAPVPGTSRGTTRGSVVGNDGVAAGVSFNAPLVSANPGMPGDGAPRGHADSHQTPLPNRHAGGHQMGGGVQAHAILEQFEARIGAKPNAFRWHGQAWIGTDTDKLWLKTEGAVHGSGSVDDGRHELFYNRAITTYFDLQVGLRTDLDSGTSRHWAALGVRGMLPWFIETEATLYASDSGHYAARLAASHDIRLTQRLILQPQADLNLYSKVDHGRHVGAGLSSIDAGLRLRYEIVPEFAPYIGVVYGARIGQTARMADDPATQIRFVFGIRSWF